MNELHKQFHFINFHVFSVNLDKNKHTHTHTHKITHIVISPYIVTSILFSDSTIGWWDDGEEQISILFS